MSATWTIVYPRPLIEYDQQTNYPLQLLTLALEQTGVKYKMIPSDRIMLQSKALKQLRENRGVNVVWSMTDKTREEELLPIRIPIYKGLIGWRIFLVKDSVKPQFFSISEVDQLLRFKAIQGYDWPDTKILQSNGFDVTTSKEYDALFSMLTQSRGDFYPRSVVEIWAELESEQLDDDVGVEENLGVRYPTAMYFFVNKRNVTAGKTD